MSLNDQCVRCGPAKASTNSTTTTANPASAPRLRTSRPATTRRRPAGARRAVSEASASSSAESSATAYAGVEGGVQQVGQQARQQDGAGREEVDGDHRVDVVVVDRVDEPLAHAVPAEDLLGERGPGQDAEEP